MVLEGDAEVSEVMLRLHLLILAILELVMAWVMVVVIHLVTVMDEQLVVGVAEVILLGLEKEELKEVLRYL